MKKMMVLFIIVSASIYSKEISLDSMLNSLDGTSYENQIYDIQKKIDSNKEKSYKLDKYNGIETSANSRYNDYEDAFTTIGRVQYGDFYLDGQKKETEKGEYTVGVEKNLKDLIFSKSNNELKKLNLTKEINKLSYFKNLENQKISLINLYKDYRANELELKIRENGLNTLKKELEIMNKSYSLGAAAKIEFNTLQYTIKNMELEINNLKSGLERIIGRFYYSYKLDIKDKKLLPLEPDIKNVENYISRVGIRDILNLELQNQVIEENLKYLRYDSSVPDISVGVEHNSKYEENRLTAKFSKKIFNFNSELENEKEQLQKSIINLEQKKEEIEAERLKLYNNLYTYQKEYEVYSNKAELENSKYEIKKLEYNLGKVSYIDVMDSFDKYLEAEIAKEKAKNSLNSYIYEIKVRSEI